MQSRLVATARRSTCWVIPSQSFRRALASAANKRTADPSVHAKDYGDDPVILSGDPEETQNVAEPKPAKKQTHTEEHWPSNGTDPLAPPKPPYPSSPRLESSGVNQPLDPAHQQERSHSTALEGVSCVGLDGTPLPNDKEEEKERDEGAEQGNDKDYFEHHKASPLSEIEMADTRKPITRATDGTADYVLGKDVIGWRPEQLDTADEALKRGTRIFMENAMRGDPTAPHSRVLRALRGEDF
ncbi:uncharacterized protein LOC107426299 [Ziziphus jujuba]|uniref:Uncharacterized protein LOC107426299 n=2 Tax=Ziziphus jujuba TaxID=326968 RepID=A0A6P4AAV6_ZIZJJ|nr:uncharacterized protein LOC107426299 [Ziziphus jujuba]KAH7517009.1 hypothetical protein FEM48_Zijuj09G0016500 [Ziziphus jujuba var. spinosa]